MILPKSNNDDQVFITEGLKGLFGPKMIEVTELIRKTASFTISDEQKEPFLQFHNYITNPQPEFISYWRNNPKKTFLYLRLVDGILTNTQNSFACVCYHQSRINHIEMEVMSKISNINYQDLIPRNSVIAPGGGMEILHFEYQAYVMAYRRCLDQFAYAISTYFQNICTSFRGLTEFLTKQKVSEVALPIRDAQFKYLDSFEFVISDRAASANEKDFESVRDKLAHKEFVSAGVVNLTADGFVLCGGGENLNINPIDIKTLTQLLENKTEVLHRCLSEMLAVFINSAKSREEKAGN